MLAVDSHRNHLLVPPTSLPSSSRVLRVGFAATGYSCRSRRASSALRPGLSRPPAAAAMSRSSLGSLGGSNGSWLGVEFMGHHARGQPCRGFVGEGASSTAGAYYSSDFPWESRVEEGEAALARQERELVAWLEQQGQQGKQDQESQQQQQQQQQQQRLLAAGEDRHDDGLAATEASQSVQHLEAGAAACSSAFDTRCPGPAGQEAALAAVIPYDRGSWESFHSQHSQARFFKERRYLLLEFPVLAVSDPPQHFVEIGCGCGSSLLPVLRANPTCRVTGCDISPTAVRLFQEAAERCGIAPERVTAFAFDAAHPAAAAGACTHAGQEQGQGQGKEAVQQGQGKEGVAPLEDQGWERGQGQGLELLAGSPPACSPLDGLDADAVLLIFTLSALPTVEMFTMLRHALRVLRPGGLLLFRDYGLYDMAQLRFHGSQMLGPSLYCRGDGTLAYFFTPEGISQLARESGFEVEEAAYACVALKNRKVGGADMKRVFVHGVFRKPHS